MNSCIVSWSGGKDSCFALMKAMDMGMKPIALLNVLNEEGKISRSHGIPKDILAAQAASMQIPIQLVASSWADYEQKFTEALVQLKNKGAEAVIFGDIDLQEHRDWEEKVCKAAGLKAVLPLWKKDRKSLVLEMLDAGIETILVSCNETMGHQYIGKTLSYALIKELATLNIDPCGENGEYHTLVVQAPLFTSRLEVSITDKLWHQGYWFASLEMD